MALARSDLAARVVIVADRDLVRARARALRIAVPIVDFDPGTGARAARALLVRHVPLAAPAVAGKLDPANSAAVLRTSTSLRDGCRDGTFCAMATAPVHKGAINDAGIAFTGHTEYLAERTGARHVVMMLVGGGMRVALATTHLPLEGSLALRSPAPASSARLRVLLADLVERFGIAAAARRRRRTESRIPGNPATSAARKSTSSRPSSTSCGARVTRSPGRCPPTRCSCPRSSKRYDCVLAMYHDQGLPVLKHAAFGGGVNVTLGLPDRAHLRRPRHGARSRRHRPGTLRQPHGGDPARRRAGARAARRLARRAVKLHRPRKRFGQNFLVDQAVVDAIVAPSRRGATTAWSRSARASARSRGRSASGVARLARHRDRPRYRRAAPRGASRGKARDPRRAMRSRSISAALGADLRVVGNLPYNISTPLLFHLARYARRHQRHPRHAADGSRGAHGRGARRLRLRAALGDAAVPLRDGMRARGAARRFPAGAGGRVGGGAHDPAPAAAAPRARRERSCHRRRRRRSPSAARRCATR